MQISTFTGKQIQSVGERCRPNYKVNCSLLRCFYDIWFIMKVKGSNHGRISIRAVLNR